MKKLTFVSGRPKVMFLGGDRAIWCRLFEHATSDKSERILTAWLSETNLGTRNFPFRSQS